MLPAYFIKRTISADELDIDTEKKTEEEIMKKFDLELEYANGSLNFLQRWRPKVWTLFDEPYSSKMAKVRP